PEVAMPRKSLRSKSRSSAAKVKTAAKTAAPSSVPRAHGRYDYSPIIDRPPLRWPNGARVALWVIPNIEHFYFNMPGTTVGTAGHGLNPDVRSYSWRDYGVRVGIW